MKGSPWLVVLAGGSGTRFWPRSRADRPKQVLPIVGDEPLLAVTVERFAGMVDADRVVVVTTKELDPAIRESLKKTPGSAHILLEPKGKNTAPAITMTMEWIRARDPKATVVIVPADHWIPDGPEYRAVMQQAVEAAEARGILVTIGIQPTRAETGFGYIRSGSRLSQSLFAVDRFVEKPSKEVAETMVQQPDYFWNAGMFVWTVGTFFQELGACHPQMLEAFVPYQKALASNLDAHASLEKAYEDAEATSIDYALMERSKNVAVVPGASFGWNDLGSFVALDEVLPHGPGGVAKAKKVLAIDSIANIVDCPGKTVALLGVTNMILVDTGDVILLAAKERAQDVRRFVEQLRQEGRKDLL